MSLCEECRKTTLDHPRALALWLAHAGRCRIAPCLRPRPIPTRPERIVVTLTSLPSRLSRMQPTLATLLSQSEPADEIVLALPSYSLRERCAYAVPTWLARCSGVRVLEVNQDLGPAMKLLPLLEREWGRETLIVALDDDVLYPRELLATLLRSYRRFPHAAYGAWGWKLPLQGEADEICAVYGSAERQPVAVDVLLGTWGILVTPSLFDRAVFATKPFGSDAFFNDDLWFSGHLARRHVPRIVVPLPVPPITRWRTSRRGGLCYNENAAPNARARILETFLAASETNPRSDTAAGA